MGGRAFACKSAQGVAPCSERRPTVRRCLAWWPMIGTNAPSAIGDGSFSLTVPDSTEKPVPNLPKSKSHASNLESTAFMRVTANSPSRLLGSRFVYGVSCRARAKSYSNCSRSIRPKGLVPPLSRSREIRRRRRFLHRLTQYYPSRFRIVPSDQSSTVKMPKG
jgi:hypothetical protein